MVQTPLMGITRYWRWAAVAFICVGLLSVSVRVPASASPLAQIATDWPMYQHDPAHSARTTATVANTGPLYVQWAHAFGERVEVEVQPIVAGGRVYVGAMNGEMHALNASTGAAVWIKRPGGPIAHTAAVSGTAVYFGSLDGSVYALSAADGTTVWRFTTGGPVVSAPAVVDGRLYIGSTDGALYALDAATGKELWRITTGGPVVSSPAVAGGRVYFGSEDMTARCADAATGALVWATPLHGAGMRNTHPVVGDDGDVVIFVTVKAGGSSYLHLEDYPGAPSTANPVQTWNAYYQTYPRRRTLYYLDTATGADLWNPAGQRYVPMPIPYWGLLEPILAPDGSAWFPAPAGTEGRAFELDRDNRLFRTDLATGLTTQVAGGTQAEFQLRPDEVGRHIFSGDHYYYTISEDLGVFRPAEGVARALFSNGPPSGYNFGSHMHPHSPLPSRHLWRYGGVIAMGGAPNASPPVVANGMVYFTSYGWLYAVGPIDRGYNPATSFPARDARLHELTYPRTSTPAYSTMRAEVATRVADIIALGPASPPIAVRWDQAGQRMLGNEFTFEVYGYDADLVRTLSKAYPHLSAQLQGELRAYLRTFVASTLLNDEQYAYGWRCVRFGQSGILAGEANCPLDDLTARWLANNPNLVGLRLDALLAYANATGDWDAIRANWSLVMQQFQMFLAAYDPSLGFCRFEQWLTGRLNIGAQIAAAQAVRDMAAHFGYADVQAQAQTLLTNLLNGRVALAQFVPNLYDLGLREPVPIRLNPDGTLVYEDIMVTGVYNGALIPYSAALRDRDTDPEQVNWWDGTTFVVDGGVGMMHYQALSGYFPLSSALIDRLRSSLLDKTRYYVKSYEVNNPWWWMADLAHHTTCSGEHLYHSPTLSWTMFQVKAWVLQEDWNTLARQLPEPVSFNARYDLYRLDNLATLLALGQPMSKRVSPSAARYGDRLTYTITLAGVGASAAISDPVPAGTTYVPQSAQVDPNIGTLTADGALVQWTGVLPDDVTLTLSFAVTVAVSTPTAIVNRAHVDGGDHSAELVAIAYANYHHVYLPIVIRRWPG